MSSKERFRIPKQAVWQAYEHSKNFDRVGIDGQTVRSFQSNLPKRIHQLWKQLSSGQYTPFPLLIKYKPKKNGGFRHCGIHTVRDNIVQNLLKNQLSSKIGRLYHPHSYWHIRPVQLAKKKAIKIAGKRCLSYNWALVLDVKRCSMSIDHQILMNMLKKHIHNKWVLLYTNRILKAPRKIKNGTLVKPKKGLLHDIMLHVFLVDFYMQEVFDEWMKRRHPHLAFERFIDDIIIHCHSEEQAKWLLSQVEQRFRRFKLEKHPKKTKIVYCKDGKRKGSYKNVSFQFLEASFQSRIKKTKTGRRIARFGPY